jgi:hypothetical protein
MRCLVFLVVSACAPAIETSSPPDCEGGKCDVWGDDDRHELYELDRTFIDKFAPSVGALVMTNLLVDDGMAVRLSDNVPVNSHLCPDQRFAGQPTPAYCSGFFAGDDIFVTAGHCLKLYPQDDAAAKCQQTSIVFGLGYWDKPTNLRDLGVISNDRVYRCAGCCITSSHSRSTVAATTLR